MDPESAERERRGRAQHLIRNHGYGPPCHCTSALGSPRGGSRPGVHLNCPICAAWVASAAGRAEAAYLARFHPEWLRDA